MFSRCFRLYHTPTQYLIIFGSLVLFFCFYYFDGHRQLMESAIYARDDWVKHESINAEHNTTITINKIHRRHHLNQLAARPLIAEVHIKRSSAIPCTAEIYQSQHFTTCTWSRLPKLSKRFLSNIQVWLIKHQLRNKSFLHSSGSVLIFGVFRRKKVLK